MSARGANFIGLLTVAAALLGGCAEQEPPAVEEVVRPVKMVTVGGPQAAVTRDFPGTIKGAQNAEMGFEVAGRIIEFMVQEGQQVEVGQPLARLDDRDYQAELEKVQANLSKAEADLQRSENIFKQDPGAISADKIEGDRRAVGVSRASLAQAQKAVEDTVLRAPFDGLVSRKLVDDFENVQAKQSVLLLQDISFLKIEVSVPERDFSAGARGVSVDELTARAEPRVEVSSLPGRYFPARVTEMATAADPVTRTFQVTLAFDVPDDAAVLPGMTARVVISPLRDAGVWLPTHAVVTDAGGEPYVWKVDPASMTVTRQTVELGEMREDSIRITGGLEDGELVAISGVQQLQEGQQVRRFQG